VEKLAHLSRQQRTELEATAPNTAAWLIQYKPFAVNEYVEREERISPNLGLNKTVMFSTMLGTHWMIQRPSKTHFNSELSDVNRNPELTKRWAIWNGQRNSQHMRWSTVTLAIRITDQ
jgi:hypothetical protein